MQLNIKKNVMYTYGVWIGIVSHVRRSICTHNSNINHNDPLPPTDKSRVPQLTVTIWKTTVKIGNMLIFKNIVVKSLDPNRFCMLIHYFLIYQEMNVEVRKISETKQEQIYLLYQWHTRGMFNKIRAGPVTCQSDSAVNFLHLWFDFAWHLKHFTHRSSLPLFPRTILRTFQRSSTVWHSAKLCQESKIKGQQAKVDSKY